MSTFLHVDSECRHRHFFLPRIRHITSQITMAITYWLVCFLFQPDLLLSWTSFISLPKLLGQMTWIHLNLSYIWIFLFIFLYPAIQSMLLPRKYFIYNLEYQYYFYMVKNKSQFSQGFIITEYSLHSLHIPCLTNTQHTLVGTKLCSFVFQCFMF